LLTAASGSLCIGAMLDALGCRLETIVRGARLRRLCGLLPVIVALGLTARALPASGAESLIAWLRYERDGTQRISNRRGADAAMRSLCSRIPPGELVAAAQPWLVHLWCGNPAVKLPLDLGHADLRARYFREQSPSLVVTDASSGPYAWLAAAPEVRELHRAGSLVLYGVRNAPPMRSSRAIPSLGCPSRAGC
jgi:hypothetical protein